MTDTILQHYTHTVLFICLDVVLDSQKGFRTTLLYFSLLFVQYGLSVSLYLPLLQFYVSFAHVPLTPPSLFPVSCQRSTHIASLGERGRELLILTLSDLRLNA